MPLAERISRQRGNADVIVKNDINRWQERFIHDLKEVTRSPSVKAAEQRGDVPCWPEILRAATIAANGTSNTSTRWR